MEYSLVWNHTRDIINSKREFDLNHKYDFISKLQDTKFNYHFITVYFCTNIFLILSSKLIYTKV